MPSGKGTKLRKPKKASSASSTYSVPCLLAAVLVVGFGVSGGLLLRAMRTQDADPASVATVSARERLDAQSGADADDTSAAAKRRRKQEGRVDQAVQARCMGDQSKLQCRAATAEQCKEDAEVQTRCCATCFKLTCKDTDPSCQQWAWSGECYKNREFMAETCCFSCSPDPSDRCSQIPSERPVVAEGDINRMFAAAIEKYPEFSPVVHSTDPYVVSFSNLLSDEECDGIVEAVGGKRGEYIKPSTTAKTVRNAKGQMVLTDVPDTIRTSHNAWCQHRGCYDHPIHDRVIRRIMKLVDLPPDFAEHMQLLKYGPGEYYKLHHDWIPEQQQATCGPRIFTFFLYLTDVEEGGGTYFPHLNITVKPKRGSAVWWPHIYDSNPWKKDDRTHHEAQAVIKGSKFAANYWIHGSDFKASMASGCDGRSGLSGRVWRK